MTEALIDFCNEHLGRGARRGRPLSDSPRGCHRLGRGARRRGWPVAKRFGFHMLDGITVTAPWPHWTSDNRHYDGGINNEARQLGSITILNELLNLLSSAVKRPLRLTTGSID